jgi:hypothetical protein
MRAIFTALILVIRLKRRRPWRPNQFRIVSMCGPSRPPSKNMLTGNDGPANNSD